MLRALVVTVAILTTACGSVASVRARRFGVPANAALMGRRNNTLPAQMPCRCHTYGDPIAHEVMRVVRYLIRELEHADVDAGP